MKGSTWALILLAVLIGVIEPRVEVAFKCREGFEHSEACVWARSYLPLGQVVAPVIVTPVALLLLLIGRSLVRRANRLARYRKNP
jgi:hypothetical protein